MTIPYRHQEILQTLFENPKGLTRDAIFEIASSKIGSEIPNKETVSKLLYTMRNATPRVITKSDAIGGDIHKITPHGLQQLAEATGLVIYTDSKTIELPPITAAPENAGVIGVGIDNSNQDDYTAIHVLAPTPQSIRSALNLLQNAGYTVLDPDNEIDTAFTTIIEYIRMAESVQPAPAVARKPVKIDTIKRLGALMSDDIKTIFDDIAADIEQLDEAA